MNFIDYSSFFNDQKITALISFRNKNYAIKKNCDSFISSLKIDPSKVVFPEQTHSSNVEIIRKSKLYNDTDGLISTTHDYGLGLLVADCSPVFLFGIKSNHFGVIHSGWRGTANKITTNALKRFVSLGNASCDIKAVIGPSIKKCCFEISSDISNLFSRKNLYPKNSSKFNLDLKNEIYDEIIRFGLSAKNIFCDHHCTFCDHDKFFSFRRDGLSAGRMVAIMKIKNS